MNFNWKRIALVAGFILVVILLAVLIYRLFFAPPPQPVAPVPETPRTTGLPVSEPAAPRESKLYRPSKQGLLPTLANPIKPPAPTAQQAAGGSVQITLVEQSHNIAPALSDDGKNIVTFDSNSGIFYRVTPQGTPTPLTDQKFKGAQNIEWSPKTDKAIIQFPDGANILYDFTKQQQHTLPSHWDEFSFSPVEDKIAFKSLGEDPDNRWFAVANSDGSGARALEDLGDKAGFFIPSWSPSGQIAGMFREGLDFYRQHLYFIGLHDENFKAVTVAGRGVETQWSPNGDRLLHSAYSDTSDLKPELWIVDAIGDRIGDNRHRLGVQTWAHKCTFADNTTIYCAVPKNLEEGAGLLPQISDNQADAIYRIDLKTGETRKIAEPLEKHTINKIVVSKDQTLLYFMDKLTGALYTIEL